MAIMRQSSARISIDPVIADRFVDFTMAMNEYVVNEILKEGPLIIDKRLYLDHVK